MPIKGPQLAVDGNNGIVLWGGVVPDNVATRKDKVNDAVYRYSIADDKWTKVSEGNPNGRAWPCEYRLATTNAKRLYFGGKKDPAANTTNDICYYENGNTQCKATPNAPRSRHSCLYKFLSFLSLSNSSMNSMYELINRRVSRIQAAEIHSYRWGH
ncbi:hypothetical protein BKA69DRAFT_214027 [Paraphysoderma sedebokerense]|nr:hypothetical protein BKA69DRAFT_214027 [Paraphysoderma sedebokerense]